MIANEAGLRLLAFATVLATLALAERAWPVRGDARPSRRQMHNAGLVIIDTALLRLAFPVLAVALAASLEASGTGLFNQLGWPLWISVPLAVLVLDLAIYWQHRLMHQIPLLWRMHRVHHSDLAMDVTTGVRFHPLEIALSMGIKLGLITLLGAPALAVVIFEVVLSLGSLFTHTDIALPRRLDHAMRRVLVTPSMHRIHHSTLREETDSNYGFHLSVWDRLFGSYRAEPKRDEARMPLGLEEFRERDDQRLLALLWQPARRDRRPPADPPD
ncbi:sterol desaturase family protein [Alkalisalibacterium limincola]|uniref:Sterol desaturase family protein n=2 Tax=Alkalisalibacterium limincola TaxID=2699169 RepID=A0A5C8KRU2_9GAMM|nr:sterol desaturase family protein [Alkalisalibacterium limincola]